MTVSRNYVEWFNRKLNETQDEIVKRLTVIPRGKIRSDEENGLYIDYNTQVNFDTLSRAKFTELKNMIDTILEHCKEDPIQF